MSNRDLGLQSFPVVGKSFRIQEDLKTQSDEESSSQMKNSLHQSVFLNAPESKRMYQCPGDYVLDSSRVVT